MDFNLSEEHVLLRDSVTGFLRAHHPFEHRTDRVSSDGARRPAIWQGFAQELGILGAAIDSDHGGLGGGPIEHMIIMEEIGRTLVREPFLETIVIGAEILSRCSGNSAGSALAAVLKGDLLLAYAWAEPQTGIDLRSVATAATRHGDGWQISGEKSAVAAAPWAAHLIVLAQSESDAGCQELSMFLVDKALPGVRCTDFPTIDGRWAADVELDDVVVTDAMKLTEGDAYPLALEIMDRAITASCAEAIGLMTQLLEDTKAHVTQRRQFGTSLSSFQVLRHRIADMLIQLEMATSSVYLATLSLEGSARQRALAVASAKVVVDDASRFVGQQAIQLHGGMGMTDELAIGHYVKRLMAISAEFGASDLHVSRYRQVDFSPA